MAVRIHHTQQKQADKLGITLVKGDMDITASKDGQSASAPSAGLAIAELLKKLGVTTAALMVSLADRVDAGTATDTELAEIAEEQAAQRPKRSKAPKAAKPAKKAKAKKARKSKFKCESCGSTKRESDGEEGGGFVCAECGEDATMDGDEDGKSVIKRVYRQKYRPHKMTCGDSLSQRIRAEFMTLKDPDTKKKRLDWPRFKKFAQQNGCWSEDYSKLNKGMRRMNVVNRLRKRIKDKETVLWTVG